MNINDIKQVSLFYFIGRLNPPHSGHISALIKLIDMAKSVNSVPLILLGSGPKLGNPLDNPITFDLKRRFIEFKLNEMKGFVSNTDYIIKEMTNPANNVSEYLKIYLEKYPQHLDTINIIHIAGGKDEDASKLDFIKKFAFNTAFELKPDTDSITVKTEIIEPVTVGSVNMSGTIVRKDAYKHYLNGDGLNGFLQEKNGLYSNFYNTMSSDIYNGIISPALKIDRINVEAYLDPSIQLGPATKKARTIKKGGNKYIKQRNNKRTYNKTNKKRKRNKTKRRYI
jgi:hypothetical protein